MIISVKHNLDFSIYEDAKRMVFNFQFLLKCVYYVQDTKKTIL